MQSAEAAIQAAIEQCDKDYDTDSVSITSTRSDTQTEDKEYEVEEILAEALFGNNEGEFTKYLVRWAGYPILECTWEPEDNFIDPRPLRTWRRKREDMDPDLFAQQNGRLGDLFDDLTGKFSHVKACIKQKRAKKRKKLGLSAKATHDRRKDVSEDSEDSEDDRPLINRRPPFDRSSSSESKTSADSLLEELKEKSKKKSEKKQPHSTGSARTRKTTPSDSFHSDDSLSQDLKQTDNKESAHIGKAATRGLPPASKNPSTQKRKPSAGTATTLPKHPSPPKHMREERPLKPSVKEPTKQRESKAAAGPRRGSAPQVQLNDTAKSTATTLAGRKASHAAVADPTSAISAKAGVPVRPGENKPITAIRSSKPRQTTTVKRSGAQPGRAINIINDPNAITRRRWENSTKDHYSKLHFRHKADVHSRSEGKPDPSALVYVNGDPSGTIRSPIQERRDAPQNGDVYGRRDVGRPRQQPDPDYYTAQYTSKDTEMDLPEWEAAKIPLSCFEWRNGQCQYHSRQCRFLHRDKDPSGHPYKPSPVYGHVPGKYAQPPLTCLFWFERASGCSKSTDECDYAHKNTGLLAQSNGPPLPIDPAKQPNLTVSKTLEKFNFKANRAVQQPKSSDLPSSSLTCYFWLRTPVGCFHQPEACKFAHRNTGLLAFKDGSTEQIDPTEEPHSSVNKDHLTCFFWTQGKCKFSATDCIYQHRDTGVMGPGPSNSKWFPKKNIPLAIRMPKVSTGESASLAMDPPLEIPAADDAEFVRPPSPDNEPEGALSLGTNILAPALTCVDLKRKIEDICKLDFKIIFQYNGDGLKESVLDRRAFLIFHPEDHSEELELITRWLVMHHVEVCSFWFEGSWDYFKGQISDGGTGVIITHPDFDWYSEIPYFGQVLKHKVSIWSVGNQIGSEWDPSISTFLPAYRYDSIPIFPHGGFIYITDDVFTKKPMEALKIVELFIARIEMCRQVAGPIDPVKRVNDGCLIWRLAVRPDFMRNLYDTCEKHEAEIEALDPVQLTRVKLYELLTRTEYIEPDDDAPFEIHPDDYWPIISERQELMPDYFEALARSQEAANAHMIRLYSGMLIEHRQSYRQYFVVHTEPEKATWQNSITNIDEVMTPEKCIEYFEQPSKGNRFEFYDWAFPEIKVNDDAAAMDTS